MICCSQWKKNEKLGGSNFTVNMLFGKQIPYSYETFELGKIVIYIFMMRTRNWFNESNVSICEVKKNEIDAVIYFLNDKDNVSLL